MLVEVTPRRLPLQAKAHIFLSLVSQLNSNALTMPWDQVESLCPTTEVPKLLECGSYCRARLVRPFHDIHVAQEHNSIPSKPRTKKPLEHNRISTNNSTRTTSPVPVTAVAVPSARHTGLRIPQLASVPPAALHAHPTASTNSMSAAFGGAASTVAFGNIASRIGSCQHIP